MGFQTLIFLINDNNQYYWAILPRVIYKLKNYCTKSTFWYRLFSWNWNLLTENIINKANNGKMGFQTLIFFINDNNQDYWAILPRVIYKLKKLLY